VLFSLFICLQMLILFDLSMDETWDVLKSPIIVMCHFLLVLLLCALLCAVAVLLLSACILETVKQYTVLISNNTLCLKV